MKWNRLRVGCLLLLLSLCLPGRAAIFISEFMADNTRTLRDEDGNYSDWIEISNPGNTAVNLTGYSLTDAINDLKKWTFPSTNISAGGTLVVFASGKDRRIPGQPLHTNFKLDAAGEYLALVDCKRKAVQRPNASFPQESDFVIFCQAFYFNDTGHDLVVEVGLRSLSNSVLICGARPTSDR